MPIKQLQSDEPGLPRAGIIRLGFKTRSCTKCKYILQYKETAEKCPRCGSALGNEFPTEAPFFVLDDAPGVAEALGTDRPAELEVFFPFDDNNLVFPNYMQFWQASSLVCRGDGEQIVYAIDPTTGRAKIRDGIALLDFVEGKDQNYKAGQFMPCPGPDRNLYPKCLNCKPNAMLIVLLEKVPRLAYFQISTTSIHNIVDLPKQLNTVKEAIAAIIGAPKLIGVPFVLKRVKREVSTPKKDRNGNDVGRRRVEKYFLQLEIKSEWVIKMLTAQRRLADPLERLALPAPAPQPSAPETEIIDTEPTKPVKPPFGFADPPTWEPPVSDEDIEVEPPAAEAAAAKAQPEPAPEPKPEQPAANGKAKLHRPMTPEQVKSALAVPKYSDTKTPGEAALDFASTALLEACRGDSLNRDRVIVYLFGKDSLKKLTAGECLFITDWIGIKAENGFKPDPNSLIEIEAILRECPSVQRQVIEPDPPPPADRSTGRGTDEEWWNRVDQAQGIQVDMFAPPLVEA